MTKGGFCSYFEPKHGHWQGEYRFAVLDLRALLLGSMTPLGKAMFACLGMMGRVLGPFQITTTVDTRKLDAGRVVHSTRISKWGIPLQVSEETFELENDRERFRISGWLRAVPVGGLCWHYEQSWGRIDERGEAGFYVFRWPHAEVTQHTRSDGDLLHVTQELDGCRATFSLTCDMEPLKARPPNVGTSL